ncbi:MAG TPA: carbohydrate kinase [Acidobacteriaceae bacterium]
MSESRGEQRVVVGLGELLWDVFPEGPRLGGAPANFAVMCGRLGDHAVIGSRVGTDALGQQALRVLESLPVDLSYLQADGEFATGTVAVALEDGEPHYTIHEPVAWDGLAFTPEWRELAGRADAVCVGTLAQRSDVSRETILEFLDATRPACVRIFDVNLRGPFVSGEVVRATLARATVVKLNAHELPQVLVASGGSRFAARAQDEEELLRGARVLLERYPARLVCVTLGGRGSLLVTRETCHRHEGVATVVRDTVGAGDAFTAALAHAYLEGATLATMNEAGNRWGAWMASQPGGMPRLPGETLAAVTGEIRGSRER